MNWMQVSTIVLSAASLVLSGLAIHWSRQARRNEKLAAAYRAEAARLRKPGAVNTPGPADRKGST